MRALSLLFLALVLFSTSQAEAYQVRAGDQLVRAELGGRFNYMRHRMVTRETPAALAELGLAYEYALLDSLSLVAGLRPGLADAYLDLPVLLGARYRFNGLNAPLTPYASAEAIFDLGLPLGPPPPHFGLGVRVAGGMEYFISSHLGLGASVGFSTGPLLWPALELESSAELLFSCAYRF